jgi:hypothetical protein
MIYAQVILIYHVRKGIYSSKLIDTSSFCIKLSGWLQVVTGQEERGRCESELLLIPWRQSHECPALIVVGTATPSSSIGHGTRLQGV